MEKIKSDLDDHINFLESELKALKKIKESSIEPGLPAYHKDYGFVIVGKVSVNTYKDKITGTYNSRATVDVAFIDESGSTRGQMSSVSKLTPISETLIKLRS